MGGGRRWWLCARAGGSPHLDPPAGDRCGCAHRSSHTNAVVVAGASARTYRRPCAGVHDGRRVWRLSKFRQRPQSGRSRRPRDPGHHECDVSCARTPHRWVRVSAGIRLPTAPSRAELLEYLSVARIAGPVATPREANLANFRLMAGRDPDYLFGLDPRGAWTFDDVLALMAQRCGVSPDPLNDSGADTVDAALTVERLEAMAGHLRTAAATKSRVLVATGHPTGVLVVHLEIARALASAGAT